MTATDGEVRFDCAPGAVALELGPLAERWAEKIANRALLDGLGVEAGQRVAVRGVADATIPEQVRARTADITVELTPGLAHALLEADERAAPDPPRACRDAIAPAGGVRLIAPKRVRRITELDVQGAGRAAGLTDIKVIRFSDTRTAHRFVIPPVRRG